MKTARGCESRRAEARYHPSLEDFEAGDIDPGRFDHEAHVYVAWRYLQRYRPAEAIHRFTDALRRLTVRIGAEAKYHETVSWFFLLVTAERMAESGDGDWEEFRRRNPDLVCGGMMLVRDCYSRERLDSDEARRRFLLPDRPPRTSPRSAPPN